MTLTDRQFSRPRRAAAWFLALLCLWMATVGVVHHTDLPRVGHSLSPRTVWGQPTAAPSGDLCAACEWTQAVQSRPPALFVLCLPLVASLRRQSAARPLLLALAPHRASPRAPPALAAA